MSRRAFLRTVLRRSALALGAFVAGLLVDTLWARAVRGARLQREDYPRFVVGGWRVHHNIVGYVLIAIGVFRAPAIFIPAGLGMIVGHGQRDRLFWFAERAE
jgi:hypothetical protein